MTARYVNSEQKHNHEILSPCTKESVLAVLNSTHRVQCLKSVEDAFCGDGVVEVE